MPTHYPAPDQSPSLLELSRAIDAAICDLLQSITTFSDPDFDSEWMNLTAEEIEAIAIHLLQHWTGELSGKRLAGILLRLREGAG